MGRKDVYSNYKMLPATDIETFVTTKEGTLIDVSAYKGIAMAVLRVLETASQAATEELLVTVHKVASEADAADADNLIATFANIVGSNTTLTQLTDQVIAVNLDLVDTQYIQFLFTETNTYECILDAFLIIGGVSQHPVSQP